MFYFGEKRPLGRLLGYVALAAIALLIVVPIVRAISPGDLLINRVRITGGPGKTDQDAVVFYNNTNETLDLNGLRLVKRTKNGITDTMIISWSEATLLLPGGIYTWANANNGFAESLGADISSNQTIANDNAIALRFGSNNTGTIIDAVGWGEALNALVEGSAYPINPGANQWLERINYQDTNNNSLDFHIINEENNEEEESENEENEEEQEEENNQNNNEEEESNNNNAQTDIVINEFVSDPPSGQDEWIELYNITQEPVNLTDWTIEDGSGAKTKLTGLIGAEENNRYYIINKPKGALNNSGDIIILRNQLNQIIDQVTYGDWNDGLVEDNAPAAGKGFSTARQEDGFRASSDKESFFLTSTPTKNGPNLITQISGGEEVGGYDYTKDIVISEIFPNPIGIDSELVGQEFIELYNRGETTVNLNGWRLDIGGIFTYEFKQGQTIKAGDYLTVNSSVGFNLNNSGATIKLHQPLRSTALHTVSYKETAEGFSYAMVNEDGEQVNLSWQWTMIQTPNKRNVFITPPTAGFSWSGIIEDGEIITFDSSDTISGGGKLSYVWNFGDGSISEEKHPEHVYVKAGNYTVVLTVGTEYGVSMISKKINIAKGQNHTGGPDTQNLNLTGPASLRLSEIFPNPKGADGDKEWLELKNIGEQTVNLLGWSISTKNKQGQSFNENLEIAPGAYFVLTSQYLPIPLGNANETITLRYGQEIIDSVSYSNAPEEQSYIIIGSGWTWTKTPTPGKANALSTAADPKTTTKNGQNLMTGTVVALPGSFSVQYFHFKPDTAKEIYQVYNSKKLFPEMSIGDRISITGTLSEIQVGPRIKTSDLKDIIKIGQGDIIQPQEENSQSIQNPPHPKLVIFNGEVAAKKSPRLTLIDEQGEVEVYLTKGSGLTVGGFKVGDKLSVTGLTIPEGDKIRLTPRNKEDIKRPDSQDAINNTVENDELQKNLLAQTRDNKKKMIQYIIIGIIMTSGLAGYLLWKKQTEENIKNN